MAERLTLRSVDVRLVLLPLRRPVVSKIGQFDQWPLILIDLQTEQGIVGRSLSRALPQGRRARHRPPDPRPGNRAHRSADPAAGRLSEGPEAAQSRRQ